MYLFLAIVKREVLAQFPGIPSRARHKIIPFLMRSMRKRNAAQFLLKVLVAKGSSSRSI
jgi:hypothetical protein